MAERGMTAAARAEAGKAQNRTAHLFEGYFDDELVRITDAPRAIVWTGNTYTALGHFLGFSGVKESAHLRIEECTVELTHCDQAKTWVAIVLNEQILDRRLVIYKVFLTDALDAIIDPVPIFDGRMDSHRIFEDDSSGTVRIVARSHWADFERKPGRRTNDAVQQLHFSGDRFFEFCSGLAAQQILGIWGRPHASVTKAVIVDLEPPGPSDNSGGSDGGVGQGDPTDPNADFGDEPDFGGTPTGSGQGGQGTDGASNDPSSNSGDTDGTGGRN